MLDEETVKIVQQAARRYPEPRAACVEALAAVQRSRGWVDDEDLEETAGLLGMSAEELEGAATYYNRIFRRPVGRHVIYLCDSITCWIGGYRDLLAALEAQLGIGFGETTPDERFTLLPASCFGACDGAPALMVNDDEHREVTPDNLAGLLDRYE